MKIQGDVSFKATSEEVWGSLQCSEIMAQCIPGCKELEEVKADTYDVLLKVGVGAVSGTYRGQLRVTDKVEPSSYSIVFEGSGRQGFVKGAGEAHVRGDNGIAVLSYDCDMEVGGLIASVGQRMLEGVGQFLLGQMFSKFQNIVGQGEAR